MNGLLLCAGLGTRFRPATNILPKPAIPLLNVPLAFYNLQVFQQLGLDKLTVNLHHLPEQMKSVFEKNADKVGVPVFFSDETDAILGTGGAIKRARPSLEGKGTFVVGNSDVVSAFSIRDALDLHHRYQPMATMIVMPHPEAGKKYGAVWVDKDDHVVDIGRTKPDLECEPFHFVGLHLIEESVFKYIPAGPCDINRDVYLKAIKEGEIVRAFKKTGTWYDAGDLGEYLTATSELLDLLPRLQHQPFFLSLFRRFWPNFDKRPNLWEGEHCDHLLTLGSQSKILMERSCQIHPTAKISGFAVFGEGVKVERDVELRNCVVGPGAVVPAGSKVINNIVIKGSWP
jgi:mannose-1-phosphate guanylyltransferase